MKFLLPFIISFSFGIVFAQNWSLFNAHDKFIYMDGDSSISDVIWADSFSVMGNDTTFFLNKQFKKFSNGIDSEYVAHYPFLNKAIIKQDNAFLFVQNTDTFRLEPANGLGSIWNYSATVTAEITAIDDDTIFGFPDSVKTITLSNNKTILISKNFGIIKQDNKELIGIQGRNVGKTFWDIYDFEVGDVFYYYFSHDDDPFYPTQEWYERNEVFGKNWSGDLLVYDINGQNLVIGENQLPLPNQPVIAQPCFTGFFEKPVVFLKASIYLNEINLFGYELLWSVSSPDTFSYLMDGSSYFLSYKEGLGLTLMSCHHFETFDEERLAWYIKDGQQYCVPSPCVGFQEQSNETEVNVFPNPTDAILNVKSRQPIFAVQLFNLQGQLVSKKNLDAAISTELNISDLLPGIYFAKVIMQDNFAYRRIIKSN